MSLFSTKEHPPTPVTLILEDNTKLAGLSFGSETECEGEVVFNTSMIGYPEAITDPSYCGQILTFTYPLIGNYGIPSEKLDEAKIKKFFESEKIHLRGIIVSEYSSNYKHWNASSSLGKWLKKHKIPAITGIDTRALTQKLRKKGTMLGRISFAKNPKQKKITDPNINNLVSQVSIKEPITYKRGRKKIVLIDCGMKHNILRSFLDRNITVIKVPWDYDPFENKLKFHGIFYSNGPGDPELVGKSQASMKKAFAKKIPCFGICMGCQIMGIAAGAKTYKLKYGHRSQNQPCIDVETNKCYITSQNHGYAINEKTLPKDWEVWFRNLNDDTIEGIKHKSLPFFSVQFHPEATPGPVDTEYLFEKFINLL